MDDNQQVENQNQSKNNSQNPVSGAGTVLDDETQKRLNEPLFHPSGLNQEDQIFLNNLLDKIERKEIDLYKPSSLLNLPVYEKLSEDSQGKADFDAFQLLSTIREIYRLCKAGYRDTYQVENLAHHIRVTKERLEQLGGDIFII